MILGYIPLFLIIGAVAVFSLQGLTNFERINKEIVEHDSLLVQTVNKMEENLLGQESYARRYLILGNSEMFELFWQRNSAFKLYIEQLQKASIPANIPVAELALLHSKYTELHSRNFSLKTNSNSNNTQLIDKQIQERLDRMLEMVSQIGIEIRQNQHRKMASVRVLGIKTFRTIELLSFIGFIFCVIAVTLITRSISRSIQKLKLSTTMISQGKFDYIPEISNKDEFGDLAKSFSDMTTQLASLEKLHLDSNPLTKLPGGTAIENELKNRLAGSKTFAFLIFDIDNFKSFNDRYGYALGNEVIKATAKLIDSTVKLDGREDNFVGHIGGDDFAAITSTVNYELICNSIIKEFDNIIPDFYNSKDRELGYIIGNTRQGQEVRFPIMTISIAVVTSDSVTPLNYLKIGEMAAEMKEHAKSITGSIFVVNRRGKAAQKPDLKLQVVRK